MHHQDIGLLHQRRNERHEVAHGKHLSFMAQSLEVKRQLSSLFLGQCSQELRVARVSRVVVGRDGHAQQGAPPPHGPIVVSGDSIILASGLSRSRPGLLVGGSRRRVGGG